MAEPLPGTDFALPLVYRAQTATPTDRGSHFVGEGELEWTAVRRPLKPIITYEELAHDYGDGEAAAMWGTFMGAGAAPGMRVLAPLLRWPGVGTRWEAFAQFLLVDVTGAAHLRAGAALIDTTEWDRHEEVLRCTFVAFGSHLGRVTTYRALALDEVSFQRILDADEIFPTGQLSQPAAALDGIIEVHGVRKVLVARLYIANLKRLIGFDPSISLHDDWQTTSIIAGGYLGARPGTSTGTPDEPPQKAVYLFELDVPIVESLGWTLERVAREAPAFLGPRYEGHEPWFCFRSPAAPAGVWFDATLQRTERYGLYTVPNLRQRLRRVWKFSQLCELSEAVRPFVAQQATAHLAYPKGQGAA